MSNSSTPHERLAPGDTGVAAVSDTTGSDTFPVRIVPIPEGETTVGMSEEATVWPRETLETSVDRGVWQGAKLLKSPGGDGHKEMFAQADPDNIVGRVTDSRYEPGVGPVLDAELLDEQLARLVEHDLVGVSPDMFRDLGDYDPEREATPADRIHAVPYITILDQGASPDASIEPADAEALAASDAGQFLLDGGGGDTDQHSESDEEAESSTDPSDPTHSMSDPDDPQERIQELQEQLAAVKQEKQQLAEQTDDLESELDDTESELEETEAELEATAERLDETEDQVEDFNRVLAERVAADSPFTADTLVEKHSTEDLAEAIVANEGLADEDDEDYDPVEKVNEQLASPPAHRGQPPEEDAPSDPEQLAAANDLGRNVLTLKDVRDLEREQLSPREYLKREYDVDPAEYETERSLRAAVYEASN